MRRENILYSQLFEALKFSEHSLFVYKRMSLILLDNIVENLLKDKAIESARSNLVFEKISKDKFNKIVESLRYFENITKHSKEFGLIHSKEKPLLEFCHTARNNTYHHLFEDERILDCCIYILFEFIKKNIQRLIDFGIYAIEHEERNRILKINKLNSFDNIFVLIKSFLDINKKPSVLTSINRAFFLQFTKYLPLPIDKRPRVY